MLYLIAFTLLFAHEDFGSTSCSLNEKKISVKLQKDGSYKIKTPTMKTAKTFKAPETEDKWDENLKQLFDTYSFEAQGLKLVLKRPETPGTIKNKFAVWKNENYECL